ncbi:zinc finger, CCHC-type containing protein [Tanacetum coccineum]|uniref:HECT-type E3 ubiquitin transferase n=1 Tax=Tanacetum coccineum TaxID=301880 RepID=A0ABQ4ZCB9_9ASTR
MSYIIVRYSKKGVDYEWIIKHKELLDFFSRRHLVMLMLPDVHDHVLDVHAMLIDRSNLMVDSFESIAHAQLDFLRAGLYIEFKNEEATEFGVMREWVIALALMRKIHGGITFDRSFFLQLVGNKVSLEDIKDVEPQLYSRCHNLLEMDPSMVDKDVIGLSFVCEEKEHGFLKATELCHGGANMVTTHFVQGFTDIVGEERKMKMCFRALEHEDLDMMLCGSECNISLEAWKAHTEYQRYEETNLQICWFWEKKMHFLLSIMSVVYVLITPIPEDGGDDATVEKIRKRAKWDKDDYVCRGLILNGMSDSLFDIYQNVKSSKELWDSLEAKYMAEDASSKKFIQHKINMDEAIQVSCIIDKLPPSWKDFKHTLKHKKEELTLVELDSHLHIEESLKVLDNDKRKGSNVVGP